MGQPGQFAPPGGEDWIGRKFAELEQKIQQLAAANVFGLTGITPKDGGTDFDGYVNTNGPAVIGGTLDVNGVTKITGDLTIDGYAKVTNTFVKENNYGIVQLTNLPGATSSPCVFFTKAASALSAWAAIQDINATRAALTLSGPSQTQGAFMNLVSDNTFALGSGSNGPSLLSSPGPNGDASIFGGGSNGSVNLLPYGTGKCQVYGNFAVTGTKAFIMDHPVHPDTMDLMHAATESPVNGVEYWGTVTLDATGKATGTLPNYFEALTSASGRNIQLTPIGRAASQVSADRIVDGSFTIYGAPGQEVDWLVKAERQSIVDGYDELSFPAEQDKPLIGPQLLD